MAVRLPNGAIVHITIALAAIKNVTAVTNAVKVAPASAAHGSVNGNFVLLESG